MECPSPPFPPGRPARRLSLLLAAALLVAAPSPARADDDPVLVRPVTGEAGAGEESANLGVALIVGDRVNLRVGPRIDNHPVAQLPEGETVIVVERVPGWYGVRVPRGFPAVVSETLVEMEGPDAARVVVRNLNLRVHPPREGRPAPGIFRDHPALGTLLTFIDREEEWLWVVAPEEIRGYVAEGYLRELGPVAGHAERLAAARAERNENATRLSAARRAAHAQTAGMKLREVLGAVQDALQAARQAGGYDRAPIVQLADRLDEAVHRWDVAPTRVLNLARALREDLEREIVLRVARYDAVLAERRGLQPSAVPALEEAAASFAAEGVIRYEPTPGWERDGVYLLWVGDAPAYVLRLTTGGELPHPDFAAHADAGLRRVVGAKPGHRIFGLPVVDVRSISLLGGRAGGGEEPTGP